jgi:serine-type D-Ala-D-Ala carboxypeptidase/endopeptidase (penicillin-binding protein 4)
VSAVFADRPSRRTTTRARRRSLLVASLAVLAVAAGTVAALDVTGRLPSSVPGDPATTPTTSALPTASRPAAPAVLTPATSRAAAAPDLASLSDLLAAPALGVGPGAAVIDAATGAVLLDQDSARARAPASVAKLATAAAALVTLRPGHRLTTRVVAGRGPGELVLVGAGDASLALAKPRRGAYPRPASLAVLADATAAALRARATATPTATTSTGSSTTTPAPATPTTVRVSVDDSLFSGPAVSPDWPSSYVGSGVVSPVSALSVDQGRVSAGSVTRERDPAVAAGEHFARLLTKRGVAVDGPVGRTTAPAGATALAQVDSATVAELVETTLATSDNDLAEALLRLVAVGRGRPGTFADGTSVVTDVLTELAVPTAGLDLLDGSGLSRGSRVSPMTLARLLVAAAGSDHPDLRALVTSLPVAAFSGTLASRFGTTRTQDGAGLVRAKTGTLTGVSTLAGVTASGGRSLIFVVMADRVPASGTTAARDALDRMAAATAVGRGPR